ncbi:MAG: hypothetical protein KC561_18175 [Myxococcales bacterium]|nr:hypothetical protein [Myxococcales bacterium]
MADATPNDEQPIAQSSDHKAWQVATIAFAATRIPLAIFAWLIARYRPHELRPGHFLLHGGEAHANWLVNAFQRWDAYWFLNIVREGYRFFGVVEQVHNVRAGLPETNVTPFPLYPLLMEVGSWATGDPSSAGLVISNVCFFFSLVYLFKLAALEMDERRATIAVWFFAVVPWTYAFSAIYSESLFFLLLVGAMYAVRKGYIFWAGVLGMLASLTRLPGVFIAIPIGWEIATRYKWRIPDLIKKGWPVLLVPAGTLGYFAYLWHLTGHPNAYFIGQQGWHKEFVMPWYHLGVWFREGMDPEAWMDATVTMIGIALLAFGYKKMRTSYWLYALASFLMLMCSSYLLGLPRYLSAIFPVYFVLAELFERYPAWARGLSYGFAVGAPVVFFVWTTWSYAF